MLKAVLGFLNLKETKLPQSGQTLLNRSDFRQRISLFLFSFANTFLAPATNFFANLDSTDFKNL
jgi:hypothetical protein